MRRSRLLTEFGDVHQRVAPVDQGVESLADDDAVDGRAHQADTATERVVHSTEGLVVLDAIAQLDIEVDDATRPGAHPTALA